MTVTLHDPVFKPLSVVPVTLQYFDELGTTFNLTFEVESTLSLANDAIDFAGITLDIFTVSEAAVGVPAVGEAAVGVPVVVVITLGVPTISSGADVDVVFQPGVV